MRWVYGRSNFTLGHDAVSQTGPGCEDAVVADLMGAWRRDQRDQAVDEIAALHQDVRGAVAPGSLEAQSESAIGVFFESIAAKGWPGPVATQALEAASVAGRDGHGGVQAHLSVAGDGGLRFVTLRGAWAGVDPVTQTPPVLAGLGSGGNAPRRGPRGI